MSEEKARSRPEDDEPRQDKSNGAPEGRGDEEDPAGGAADAGAKPAKSGPSYPFLGVASAIFLVADLATKEWAVQRLEKPGEAIKVVDGLSLFGHRYHLQFDLAKNRGGAWGVFGDQPDYVRLPFFFLISAAAVVFIVSLYRKLEPRQWALKWALPLVLGGAIGNLVDRVRHQHVIDFIDAFVEQGGRASHWPTFNVADIWIVAGVLLMVVDMFTPRRKPARAAPKPARAE